MHEDIYWQKYAARFKSFPSVLSTDDQVAGMAICIPAYAEPDLLITLESLWHCELPDCIVDVLICFNKNNEIADEELSLHLITWKNCQAWVENHNKIGLRFRSIYYETLPDPKGGVGWARKMVMDEAARRLEQSGVIVCLDSDCTVEVNYLRVIHRHFLDHSECDAVSVYYEHPFELLDGESRQAIADYELHLRYLVHALRWAGHPFAYQTVGSSMAVRRSGYLAHGGMNTRKAGEDFYFLQKFIEVGALQEIKTTTIYPSARVSYRVPFGTGRAMNHLLSNQEKWMTTSFDVYLELKFLLGKIDRLHQICVDEEIEEKEVRIRELFGAHPQLMDYLDTIDFPNECMGIAKQTASAISFRKRFFRFFNAFKVIRYSHYMRDHLYPDVPVKEAVTDLLTNMEMSTQDMKTAEDFLRYLRKMDRDIGTADPGSKKV